MRRFVFPHLSRLFSRMRTLSIRERLFLLVGGAVTIALVLCTAGFMYHDIQVTYRMKEREMSALAEVLSVNEMAPVEFEDEAAAEEVLESLRTFPSVLVAKVFTADGEVLACYPPDPPGPFGIRAPHEERIRYVDHRIDGNSLACIETSRFIESQGERIGSLVLLMSTAELQEVVANHCQVAVGVLISALCISFLITMRWQYRFTSPILELVQAMKKVGEGKNYSVRVSKSSHDELGVLQEGFNSMIDQMDQSRIQLEQANDELEARVYQRTSELSRANQHLAREIAKQKLIEDQLKDAKETAESANRTKSEFLANMSHEIRTPMTAILGFTDLLKDSFHSPQDVQEYVHVIQRNGKHLLNVINDILDISKIEAGKMELEWADCEVESLVDQSTELMAVNAESKGLSLSIRYLGPIPRTIWTDAVRVRQTLMNLLGNAIKFTKTGGVSIAVRMATTEEERRLCEEREDDEEDDRFPRNHRHIVFEIIDTGIGIQSAKQKEVFDTFSQANTTSSRQFGGTGLGLSISQRLARLLGGNITLESKYRSGSTFRVFLTTGSLEGVAMIEPESREVVATDGIVRLERGKPVRDPDQAEDESAWRCEERGWLPPEKRIPSRITSPTPVSETPSPSPPSDAVLAGKRILLVEDGVDNQRLISFFLKKSGAEVTVANHGEEGIREYHRSDNEGTPFDLILMDMQMPVCDGYRATTQLREGGCGLPIIALTAHAMEGDRRRCLEAGCDQYLSKPLKREELFEAISSLLVRSQASEKPSS